ncbi:MAG: hypothetical protein J6P65_03090 [Bacteroidales bacterium]|jgi:hypothetical protein|nr:hypothetical protein [Bacteroidales bacterium]
MTKKILSWSAVAVVALIILSVAVVSCKKSETSNEDNNSVVGVWSGTEGNTDYKLTFSDNKTGLYEDFYHSSSGEVEHVYMPFDYTMTDSQSGSLTLHDDDGSYLAGDPEILYFEIISGNMVLYRYHYGNKETICLLHKE